VEASTADHGKHKQKDGDQTTAGACHGSDSDNKGKSRADLYAGVVAQRVLYRPTSRCRGGGNPRRAAAGNGKPPSRLSKMSGAAEAT